MDSYPPPAKNQNPAAPKSAVRIRAAKRRIEAMRLRQEGYSYKEIAEQLGCSSQLAWQIIHDEFARLRAERNELAENVLQLTKDRLDRLLTIYFDKAMKGDRFAADMVVKLLDRQTRLFGLEAPKRTESSVIVTNTDDPERLRAQARMQGLDLSDLENDDNGSTETASNAGLLPHRPQDSTGRDDDESDSTDG